MGIPFAGLQTSFGSPCSGAPYPTVQSSSAPAKRGRGTARERGGGGHSASKKVHNHSNDRISRFVNSVCEINDGNAHDGDPARF